MNNGFNARGCIVIAAKNKKIVESIKRLCQIRKK